MRERRLASEQARGRGRNRPSHEPVASAPARSQAGATVYNDRVRRALDSGALAVAALIPPIVWLLPALGGGRAPTFRDQADFFFPLKLYTADRLRAGASPALEPALGRRGALARQRSVGCLLSADALLSDSFAGPRGGLLPAASLRGRGLGHVALLQGRRRHRRAARSLRRRFSRLRVSRPRSRPTGTTSARSPTCPSSWPSRGRACAPAPPPRASACCSACRPWPEARSFRSRRFALALLFLKFRRAEPEGGWRQTSPRESLRRGAAAAALGLALAAWVLLPMAELALHSGRRAAFPAAERDLGAVRLGALVSALVAGEDALGRNFFFASLYLGPVVLVAVAAAFAERERRSLVWLLAAVAGGGDRARRGGPAGDMAARTAWIEPHPIPRQGAHRDSLCGRRAGRSRTGHAAVPAGAPEEVLPGRACGGRRRRPPPRRTGTSCFAP